MNENVVCISQGLIGDGLYISGHPEFDLMLKKIEGCRFVCPRDEFLESNTSVRQLVTYIMLQRKDKFFIYQRTKKTGEGRLAGKLALPGGHMNSLTRNIIDDISYDSLRELNEELIIKPKNEISEFYFDGIDCKLKILGIIQTSGSSEDIVQKVHTGIIVKVDVDDKFDIKIRESSSMINLTPVGKLSYDLYLENSELWLQSLLPWSPQLLEM